MEQTFRQLQFDRRSLTTLRTRLTRVVWRHLMEMLPVAFGCPLAPVKEYAPRSIRNRLGEMSVLDHVAGFEFLSDNGIKIFVVKKLVDNFGDKVKALAGNHIILPCQSVFCLIPSSASVLFTRKVLMQASQLLFGLTVKARILFFFTLRSRQKIVCANVYTTSRLRNTFQRIWHFANDEAIPAARRLFQRDLFRVSTERTVLEDLDFTEFRHFQTIIPSACFVNRILTNTVTCLEFIFSHLPRQGTNRTLELRIPFFLRAFPATALKMLMGSVDAFDRLYLYILGVIGIVRGGGTQFLQVVYLVIHRHRLATIVPHLISHLEHIVLQLLLVAQLRKKPLLLCFRWIRTIFKRLFHGLSRITPLTPLKWVGPTRNLAVALQLSVQRDMLIIPQFGLNVKYILGVGSFPRGRIFLPDLKERGFQSVVF